MADFDVQILGLKELEVALSELSDAAARRALRKGGRKGANVVRDAARAKVRKKTGRLRRSIRTRERRAYDDWSVVFGVEVPKSVFYGRFGEYGTSKMPAWPYMRPAAEENTEAAVVAMRDSLAEAIQLEMQRARR